jgi:hypothetical protein
VRPRQHRGPQRERRHAVAEPRIERRRFDRDIANARTIRRHLERSVHGIACGSRQREVHRRIDRIESACIRLPQVGIQSTHDGVDCVANGVPRARRDLPGRLERRPVETAAARADGDELPASRDGRVKAQTAGPVETRDQRADVPEVEGLRGQTEVDVARGVDVATRQYERTVGPHVARVRYQPDVARVDDPAVDRAGRGEVRRRARPRRRKDLRAQCVEANREWRRGEVRHAEVDVLDPQQRIVDRAEGARFDARARDGHVVEENHHAAASDSRVRAPEWLQQFPRRIRRLSHEHVGAGDVQMANDKRPAQKRQRTHADRQRVDACHDFARAGGELHAAQNDAARCIDAGALGRQRRVAPRVEARRDRVRRARRDRIKVQQQDAGDDRNQRYKQHREHDPAPTGAVGGVSRI